MEDISISLDFIIKDIWNDKNVIDSQINRIEVSIKNDNKKIGEMRLVTSPTNLIAIDGVYSEGFEIWENSDRHSWELMENLVDYKGRFNNKVVKREFPAIEDENYLSLLVVEDYKIKRKYEGKGVTDSVFDILKNYFVKHLFILKAFPVTYFGEKKGKEFIETDYDLAVEKLKKLYIKQGFKELNVRTDYSYLILLNSAE